MAVCGRTSMGQVAGVGVGVELEAARPGPDGRGRRPIGEELGFWEGGVLFLSNGGRRGAALRGGV